MKLLLASNGSFLIEKGYGLLGIPKDQLRIGYITTASKGVADLTYLERHKQAMIEVGYVFEEFDIEGKREQEILNFFRNKNVIHIEGGNSFYLLKVIKEVGFDKTLRQLLEGGLVYVGTSAGANIMCPNIEVATYGKHAEKRFGLEDLTALNYVPFCLKVHYTDDKKEEVKAIARKLKSSLRILRDGQGLFIEDGKCTFVGDGEEVRLSMTFEDLGSKLKYLHSKHRQLCIGIDGGGGAGKSTFAVRLAKEFDASIINLDFLYKPEVERKNEDQNTDVNVDFDWDRIEKEIMNPLRAGQQIIYQEYDWDTNALDRHIAIPIDKPLIIEGGYVLQKRFRDVYDYSIYLEAPADVRLKRIFVRDGEDMRDLWERAWLPAEQRYREVHKPYEAANLVVDSEHSDFEHNLISVILT